MSNELIVFLDLDGCIAIPKLDNETGVWDPIWKIQRPQIQYLKNALFRTHFTGVLSSTWRLSEKKTQEFFDADPFLAENFSLKTGKSKDSRSQEIQDWLKDSEYGASHKYFVIIDDEDCSDLFPEENLVKTKTGQGLTPKTSRVMRDKILALEKKYNIPVTEKQEGFF